MTEAAFFKNLMSVVLDNKFDRHVKGKKSGRLHTRSLYKVNHSQKLFTKRESSKNKDYAVSLVIDCSGSMDDHEKINKAAQAAESLSKCLSLMDIPHNIVLFSNDAYELKPFDSKRMKGILSKCRGYMYGWLYYIEIENKAPYLKEYAGGCRYKILGSNEEFKNEQEVAKKFNIDVNKIRTRGQGGTYLPLGVGLGIEKIKKEKGKKIVIVLSDGDTGESDSTLELPGTFRPYSEFTDTKKMVDRAIKDGIEMYSICIQDDHSNQYFPPKRTCSVYELEQLYDHIIKMVKINLKRG